MNDDIGDVGTVRAGQLSATARDRDPRREETGRWAGPYGVRVVAASELLPHLAGWGASFLQLPQWASVKPGWRSEVLGWFDVAGDLVGGCLVLYRKVPGTGRSVAYCPEGPVLPWVRVARSTPAWLSPLITHVRERGAIALRIGIPLVHRVWDADTVRRGLADARVTTFADLPADRVDAAAERLVRHLTGAAWRETGTASGFAAGQPRFGVRVPLTGRSQDEILASLSSQWRRNLARSAARNVVVRTGDAHDLTTFHVLYLETAQRDGFTPRPAHYFDQFWQALDGGTAEPLVKLYLAEVDGECLAAALVVTVGEHAWYCYGASTARRRDVRAANALQWAALCDALEAGCEQYDLRGITGTLDPDDPLTGLLRFKLGLRGECVEYVGEWELPLSRAWYWLYSTYLERRARRSRPRRGDGQPTGEAR